MLYYFFTWVNKVLNPPGFDVFKFITFRSAVAAFTAFFLSIYFGPKLIKKLQKLQIGEAKKIDGPQSHWSKVGTPTMGGILVISTVTLSTLFWSDVLSIYIILALFVTLFLAGLGFLDDYLKVIKKFKNGLVEKYKLLGQFIVSLILALAIYYLPQFSGINSQTTIPFMKDANLDFGILYIPVIIFIITATSNAVNLTDGLDGLSIGTFSIVSLALAFICYISGNYKWADYFNIIYLPGSGELTIFAAALLGASIGFLWFNSYPAQIFMGDTGSLALGGALGVISILVKKELLLPLLGGIYFIETLSVIIQRFYFKYTKKKYGEGRRVFKMAPIHHHFEMKGWPEPKIVVRFYIITAILVLLSLTSFKIR